MAEHFPTHTVCILGRPNVGKSTLFNALCQTNRAIVDDRPGITRDRIIDTVSFLDEERHYLLIDTGGFETPDMGLQPFSENLVWQQTEAAIEQSDVLVVVFDGRAGVCIHDEHITKIALRSGKPVFFTVNKLEARSDSLAEFYSLGVEELMPISAAHRQGLYELRENIEKELIKIDPKKKLKSDNICRVALIGRPNSGKSSLLNRLCGENRALVSEIAGTTRDSIDVSVRYNNCDYVFVDTAGIRKKSKIKEKVESLSVIQSLIQIKNADIVLLLIDGKEGFEEQDARLSDLCLRNGKPILLVVNKWDLVEEKDANSTKEYTEEIHYKIKSHSYVPVAYVSCKTNLRVSGLVKKLESLRDESRKRCQTSDVNKVLEKLVASHTPALIRKHNKRVKFFYASQVSTMPPTIVIKCNVAEEIQESYKRYLTNGFRRELGMEHMPLKLIFRGKEAHKDRNPRAKH